MGKLLNVLKIYRTKEWLYQKYIVEKKPSLEISKIVGADRKTIDQWLKKVGIKKRGFGGSEGIKSKEWLFDEYIIKNGSLNKIAKLIGQDRKTIHRWLIKYNIPRHPIGDHNKGKYSVHWKGGKTKSNGYIFRVRNGKYYPEHRIVAATILKRGLKKDEVIHHIDKNRINNKPENLYVFPSQKEHKAYHQALKYGYANTPILKSNLIKGL